MSPDVIVAALAETILGTGVRLAGTMGFCVHTDDGPQRFVIDTGFGTVEGVDEARFDGAKVRVFAFEDVFPDLLRAPERLAGHLSSGEFVVEGDLRLLTRVADLLEAPERPLQTRLRATLPAAAAAR